VIVILIGVSGVGKSAVGARLAADLGWEFIEGDKRHSVANIEKMARGEALGDEDRRPWLAALRDEIERVRRDGGSAVVTCSALKRAYREALRRPGEPDIVLVHLIGSPALVRARMEQRAHFMKPGMLEGQLATLEPPGPDEGVIAVDVDAGVERIVAEVRRRAGL
jgi:gluconokinase